MAATRLIPMHANKGRSVAKSLKGRTDYVKDDEKTEDGRYIRAYECSPQTVDKEFAISKMEYERITGRSRKNDVIAYQIRQAFKPGEIGPEEANEIGYELAMSFTKGKHAFIVATHTDKEHIHNHIVFNSTKLDCTGKFNNFFLSSFVIQRISDGLCLQHGLSVIKPRKYSERDNKGYQRSSIRSKICADIDRAFEKNPDSIEALLYILEQQGYQIKSGKNIAVKGREQERFIRLKSLPSGYDEESIKKRIAGDFTKSNQLPEKKMDLLINIQEKLAQGKGIGYERWAKKFNVKQMSKVLLFLEAHDVRDYATLADRAKSASKRFDDIRTTIKACEDRMKEISELRKQIINYSKTKDVYVAYRKSGYNPRFLEKHRTEITLHKAAKAYFEKLDGKIPSIKELNSEFEELLSSKRAAYAEYNEAKNERNEYVIAKQNIDAILNADFEQQQKHHEKGRGQTR